MTARIIRDAKGTEILEGSNVRPQYGQRAGRRGEVTYVERHGHARVSVRFGRHVRWYASRSLVVQPSQT